MATYYRFFHPSSPKKCHCCMLYYHIIYRCFPCHDATTLGGTPYRRNVKIDEVSSEFEYGYSESYREQHATHKDANDCEKRNGAVEEVNSKKKRSEKKLIMPKPNLTSTPGDDLSCKFLNNRTQSLDNIKEYVDYEAMTFDSPLKSRTIDFEKTSDFYCLDGPDPFVMTPATLKCLPGGDVGPCTNRGNSTLVREWVKKTQDIYGPNIEAGHKLDMDDCAPVFGTIRCTTKDERDFMQMHFGEFHAEPSGRRDILRMKSFNKKDREKPNALNKKKRENYNVSNLRNTFREAFGFHTSNSIEEIENREKLIVKKQPKSKKSTKWGEIDVDDVGRQHSEHRKFDDRFSNENEQPKKLVRKPGKFGIPKNTILARIDQPPDFMKQERPHLAMAGGAPLHEKLRFSNRPMSKMHGQSENLVAQAKCVRNCSHTAEPRVNRQLFKDKEEIVIEAKYRDVEEFQPAYTEPAGINMEIGNTESQTAIPNGSHESMLLNGAHVKEGFREDEVRQMLVDQSNPGRDCDVMKLKPDSRSVCPVATEIEVESIVLKVRPVAEECQINSDLESNHSTVLVEHKNEANSEMPEKVKASEVITSTVKICGEDKGTAIEPSSLSQRMEPISKTGNFTSTKEKRISKLCSEYFGPVIQLRGDTVTVKHRDQSKHTIKSTGNENGGTGSSNKTEKGGTNEKELVSNAIATATVSNSKPALHSESLKPRIAAKTRSIKLENCKNMPMCQTDGPLCSSTLALSGALQESHSSHRNVPSSILGQNCSDKGLQHGSGKVNEKSHARKRLSFMKNSSKSYDLEIARKKSSVEKNSGAVFKSQESIDYKLHKPQDHCVDHTEKERESFSCSMERMLEETENYKIHVHGRGSRRAKSSQHYPHKYVKSQNKNRKTLSSIENKS